MKRARQRLLLCCVLLAALGARAQPLIFVPSDALANDMLTGMLATDLLRDATGSAKERSSGPKPAVPPAGGSTASVGAPRMPGKLTAGYPAQQRVEAQRLFSTLLQKYRSEMEPRLGVPRDDLAGAVAAFLAGSWMAFRNVDFPDGNFKPLMEQVRGVIRSNAAFAKASGEQRQELYEQMAILGMLMAGTQRALKEKPNPQLAASARHAAKGYLEQFLKTDAERVQITSQGLVLK